MDLHKPWIAEAVSAGLARVEPTAEVTIKDVPNKGDKRTVKFDHIVFLANTPDEFQKLATLAESARGTFKDDDGNDQPDDHPLAKLLTYGYGLNCRAKVRQEDAKQFEDPEKAIKKIADALVKSGKFKSVEKALAAARLLQETDDDDEA